MAVNYTSNLKLGLPTTGTESGTWGDVVNQQITTLLDQSVAGTVSLTSMTNADYTLTNGNGNAANEARYMALLVPATLTLTVARNIIVPTSSKAYIVRNLTTGGFAVTVKTSGGSGISVPNGKTMALYCDGTNVINGTDYLASLTLGTALPVASGGTGATTLTLNNVLLGNGTSTPQFVAPGASGNFLTSNGTTWQSGALSIPGLGGTTITGNVTLTAASAATMSVTPTAPGLYATLPNATTCTEADNLYSIYNAGDYDYGVKNSAGTQLGWIRSRTGAMIGLSDNSTAAGVWAYYGLEKLGITASYINMTSTGSSNQFLVAITLDANRTCFLFGGTSCYAVVYDASTQTWGSATLVRATVASGAFIGVLSATNQVLVCSNDSTTGMQTVTLTISGTGVTVNTPVSTTLAGNWAQYGQLIPVSTSWVLSYGRATTTSAIRAITVSGTVPTVGAESVLAPANTTSAILFASGAVVRTVALDTTTLSCAPYTVSGSTLTVGTAASVTTTNAFIRSFLNGNGNIVCQYHNGTHFATLFKLTGTAEAASSVSLGSPPSFTANSTDYVQVTASKTAFFSGSNGAWACNILTDTSGTASAGTEITGTANGNPPGICQLPSTGNNASFSMGENNGAFSVRTFDCSGVSPVATSSVKIVFVSTTVTISSLQGTTQYGVKSGSTLVAGQGAYSIATNVPNAGYFSTNIVDAKTVRPPIGGTGPSIGVTGSVTYALAAPTHLNTTGVLIQKLEAAA